MGVRHYVYSNAVILDLYSRQVVGWAMSDRNDTKLVADALMMAVWRRGNLKNLVVHSDQKKVGGIHHSRPRFYIINLRIITKLLVECPLLI